MVVTQDGVNAWHQPPTRRKISVITKGRFPDLHHFVSVFLESLAVIFSTPGKMIDYNLNSPKNEVKFALYRAFKFEAKF